MLAVYTVTLYNENKDTVTILQDQKSNIESELQELIANYDEVIQDNKIKDKDLLEARERIEVLLNAVKDSKANIALIRRYKSEIGKLKDERTFLFKTNEFLSRYIYNSVKVKYVYGVEDNQKFILLLKYIM
mgnify:CR=1 FL=1